MDLNTKLFLTVFSTVFLAEMGDKTQLATMLFSANTAGSRWLVFAGAATALVLTSALGVAAGEIISRFVSPKMLGIIAGVGFIAVGIWTIVKA